MIADTFPVPRAGDIAQFRDGGGIDLATGAAGVLYALARTGAGRFPGYDDWLRKQAVSTETGPGLYDGLHGVAHILDDLGTGGVNTWHFSTFRVWRPPVTATAATTTAAPR